jgi:hypothetical protein
MNRLRYIIFTAVMLIASNASAQTAKSLFWVADSLQVEQIVSDISDCCEAVGHCGPAVENSHIALRLMFNDSGAIDLYSKTGRGMELQRYLWYPSAEAHEMSGCDAYVTGETLGLGGIALWDGKNVVNLQATGGRTAKVGETKKGSYAEIIAYGVEYMGEKVDVSIRVDVTAKSRDAVVTASELSGKKVQFVSGVNHYQGQKVTVGEGCISVWGPHPIEDSFPIGAGIRFSVKDFPVLERAEDMVRIISKPLSQVKTTIVGASVKEAELNSAKRFETYMIK